jgi:hypothetical protein
MVRLSFEHRHSELQVQPGKYAALGANSGQSDRTTFALLQHHPALSEALTHLALPLELLALCDAPRELAPQVDL